jgi:hypothetical protein
MCGRQHQQQSFNEHFTALILEEAENLHNKLTIELTNRVMTTAADSTAIIASSLPTANNRQKLTHYNNAYYETEEPKYNNNQTLIYNKDQE